MDLNFRLVMNNEENSGVPLGQVPRLGGEKTLRIDVDEPNTCTEFWD
jgi:hypothetical protein